MGLRPPQRLREPLRHLHEEGLRELCSKKGVIQDSKEPRGKPRFPLKGSFKGNLRIDTDSVCIVGGGQNYGPFLGVHIKGDIDIDVDIDTDS